MNVTPRAPLLMQVLINIIPCVIMHLHENSGSMPTSCESSPSSFSDNPSKVVFQWHISYENLYQCRETKKVF